MDYKDTSQLKIYIKKALKPSRYEHSLGVAEMAQKLASIYGEDTVKAYYAGLAHDIAKCLSEDEMNKLVNYYNLPSKYLNNTALAHSKVGAEILKDKFNVDDIKILNAVAYHTTGRYGMSLFEEILYVSDVIDRTRVYSNVDELRKLALTDLDAVCLEIALFSVNDLESGGKPVDEDTYGVIKYIKEKQRETGGEI